MSTADPKRRQEINDLLTGPPRTLLPRRPEHMAAGAGELPAPAWWRGDEEAVTSSQVAAAQARR